MEATKYVWDITLLKEMKAALLNEKSLDAHCREEDIKMIDELLLIALDKEQSDVHSFQDRIQLVRENRCAVRNLPSSQKEELRLLREVLKPVYPVVTKKKSFTIEDVLSLLEEFIDWFPERTLAQFLKIYYDRDFKTHFRYCKRKMGGMYYGSIYPLHYFTSPFVLVTKESFIETFVTLVHELGHFLIYVLDLEFARSKCGYLFSELDGRYFEALAHAFLKEKNIYVDESFNSEIRSYNGLIGYLENLTPLALSKTFFSYTPVKDILCEIYSYLGSLELLDRYNGNYEKQLYDLLEISKIQGDDLEMYLKTSEFHWRENKFKVLEKHREWLMKN